MVKASEAGAGAGADATEGYSGEREGEETVVAADGERGAGVLVSAPELHRAAEEDMTGGVVFAEGMACVAGGGVRACVGGVVSRAVREGREREGDEAGAVDVEGWLGDAVMGEGEGRCWDVGRISWDFCWESCFPASATSSSISSFRNSSGSRSFRIFPKILVEFR